MDMFLAPSSSEARAGQLYKAKNIKQTETLIILREAILRLANYFYTADPNCMPDDPDLADDLQVICLEFLYE